MTFRLLNRNKTCIIQFALKVDRFDPTFRAAQAIICISEFYHMLCWVLINFVDTICVSIQNDRYKIYHLMFFTEKRMT